MLEISKNRFPTAVKRLANVIEGLFNVMTSFKVLISSVLRDRSMCQYHNSVFHFPRKFDNLNPLPLPILAFNAD